MTQPQDQQGPDLRAAVAARLAQDALIDAHAIQVFVDGGVVTLVGETPGASDVAHAELLARQTPGVTEVRNRLVHHPGLRRIDQKAEDKPAGPDHWASFTGSGH